jgi:hypothetical protein
MPAITACMDRATSRPARVTFASTLDEGEVLVRVRESNSSRHECIVTGGAVSVWEPLSDVDRRAGEGDPEFQPGASRPAARNCRSVEAAVNRTGEHLGWLIRNSC